MQKERIYIIISIIAQCINSYCTNNLNQAFDTAAKRQLNKATNGVDQTWTQASGPSTNNNLYQYEHDSDVTFDCNPTKWFIVSSEFTGGNNDADPTPATGLTEKNNQLSFTQFTVKSTQSDQTVQDHTFYIFFHYEWQMSAQAQVKDRRFSVGPFRFIVAVSCVSNGNSAGIIENVSQEQIQLYDVSETSASDIFFELKNPTVETGCSNIAGVVQSTTITSSSSSVVSISEFDNQQGIYDNGVYKFKIKDPTIELATITFYIQVQGNQNLIEYLGPYGFDISCGSTSTTVTAPTYPLNAYIVNRQTNLNLIVDGFTVSNTNCALTSLLIEEDSVNYPGQHMSNGNSFTFTPDPPVSGQQITLGIPDITVFEYFFRFNIKSEANGMAEATSGLLSINAYNCIYHNPSTSPTIGTQTIKCINVCEYQISVIQWGLDQRCTFHDMDINPSGTLTKKSFTSNSFTLERVQLNQFSETLTGFKIRATLQDASTNIDSQTFSVTTINCLYVTYDEPSISTDPISTYHEVAITSSKVNYILNINNNFKLGSNNQGCGQFSVMRIVKASNQPLLSMFLPNSRLYPQIISQKTDSFINIEIPRDISVSTHDLYFRIGVKLNSSSSTFSYSKDIHVQITYTLDCSTAVTIPSILPNSSGLNYLQVVTTDKYEYVINSQFTFSDPSCNLDSISLEPISTGTASDFTITSGSQAQLTSSTSDPQIKVEIPIIDSLEKLFSFRIMGSHILSGNQFYTSNILVKVINCKYSKPNKVGQLLEISMQENSITQTQWELSNYFQPLDTNCPIIAYKIENMKSSSNGSALENINSRISITNSGKLTLINQTALEKHDIYIQASSDESLNTWSDSTPVVSLEITVQQSTTQTQENTAPQFISPINDQKIIIYSNQTSLSYFLPSIVDAQNDKFNVIFISGLTDSITYDQNQIKFSDPKAGKYDFQVNIEDELGLKSEYSFKIEIEVKEKEIETQKDDKIQDQTKKEEVKQEIKPVQTPQQTENMKQLKHLPKLFVSMFDGSSQWNKTKIKDEEKERNPITMVISQIYPDGLLQIYFSEFLKDSVYWDSKGLNMSTINKIRNAIFEINYKSNLEITDLTRDKIPIVQDWYIVDFNKTILTIQLNFTNPLYVSSGLIKDKIYIKVINNNLFQAESDGLQIVQNFTTPVFKVPSQASSKEEFAVIEGMGSSVQNSMIMTLVIPFCCMMFMSMSMEKVWGFYLMLQLASNLINFENLLIPANAQYVLLICSNISQFDLLDEINIKKWLEIYVIQSPVLRELLFEAGTMIISLVLLLVFLFIVFFVNKRFKKIKLFEKIKESIMWSSVFRGQIQFYFPTCIGTFQDLPEMDITKDWYAFFSFVLQFAFLIFLPIFSYLFLSRKKNYDRVNELKFKQRYGTLYDIYNTSKPWTTKRMLTIFCIRRIMVAALTIFVGNLLIVNIYIQAFATLYLIKLNLNEKPLNSMLTNRLEVLNEMMLYFSVYYICIFSEWILDLETRSTMGYTYIALMSFVSMINILVVLNDVVMSIVNKYKQIRAKMKGKKQNKNLDSNQNQDLNKSNDSTPEMAPSKYLDKSIIPDLQKQKKQLKKFNFNNIKLISVQNKSQQDRALELKRVNNNFNVSSIKEVSNEESSSATIENNKDKQMIDLDDKQIEEENAIKNLRSKAFDRDDPIKDINVSFGNETLNPQKTKNSQINDNFDLDQLEILQKNANQCRQEMNDAIDEDHVKTAIINYKQSISKYIELFKEITKKINQAQKAEIEENANSDKNQYEKTLGKQMINYKYKKMKENMKNQKDQLLNSKKPLKREKKFQKKVNLIK